MSEAQHRYTVLLQNIPVFPGKISTTELRQLLIKNQLLCPHKSKTTSNRMLQRTIEKIITDHPCIEIQPGKPNKYWIAEGEQHPVNTAALASALPLKLIEHEIESMLPLSMRKDVASLFGIMDTESEKRQSIWHNRYAFLPIDFQLTSPEINAEHVQIIEQAITDKKMLNMIYRPRVDHQPKYYQLTPVGILLYGKTFFLVAQKEPEPDTSNNSKKEMRTFAIQRVESVAMSFNAVDDFSDFNTHTYIKENIPHFSGGQVMTVTLRINNDRGFHLIHETKVSACQQIIADDGKFTTITAQATDSYGFTWWLMKHADIVEVIAPARYRQQMKNILTKALAQYK
jgi:predicted DNA-binding transcriptional regulator YafY